MIVTRVKFRIRDGKAARPVYFEGDAVVSTLDGTILFRGLGVKEKRGVVATASTSSDEDQILCDPSTVMGITGYERTGNTRRLYLTLANIIDVQVDVLDGSEA